MPAPSVTYTFTNGTASDAGSVNTNFSDIIAGLSDGTKDLSVSAIAAAGVVTLSNDFVLSSGQIASSLPIKVTRTYDIGSADLGLRIIYLGMNSTHTIALAAPSSGASADYSLTLPATVGVAGQALQNTGSGTLDWKPMQVDVSAKSADYTITTTDGISVVAMTTGGTDRTITLPDAASSVGRKIIIKKVDGLDSDGTGKLTIARAGSDTIGGATSQLLFSADDNIEIVPNGTDWNILKMRQVEYAYNSDTTNASDTTDFAYGPGGVIMPNRAVGTSVAKRITWLSAQLETDRVFAETNDASSSVYWVISAQQYPYSIQGSLEYGMNLVGVTSTTIDVTFGSGGSRSASSSYASNGTAWSTLSGANFKWRMVKVRII